MENLIFPLNYKDESFWQFLRSLKNLGNEQKKKGIFLMEGERNEEYTEFILFDDWSTNEILKEEERPVPETITTFEFHFKVKKEDEESFKREIDQFLG